MERRNRETLERWKENNERFYTEEEIEPCVDKYVKKQTMYCYHDWLRDTIKTVNKRCGRRRCFCEVSGRHYVSEYGYHKLIDFFSRREMLFPEDADQWKKDILK